MAIDSVAESLANTNGTLIQKLNTAALYASMLGLVPDEESEAVNNSNMLYDALNTYGNIVIDDIYYFGEPTVPLKSSAVKIVGVKDAEMRFDSKSMHLFDTNLVTDIYLDHVKFHNVSTSGNGAFLFYNAGAISPEVHDIYVNHCTFEGPMSLYRFTGDPEVSFSSYGIDTFTFTDNKLSNTGLTFVMLLDVPLNKFIIRDNDINNINYSVFYIGINNTTVGIGEYIKYLDVENNYFYNDSDCWGKSSVYHCFLLFEGKYCRYVGNHVEGLKSTSNISVYDAYFNCDELEYYHNTWKNNICFHADKIAENNCLLKSKGSATETPTRRLYRGNKYIVEEDYAALCGMSASLLYVGFSQINSMCDNLVIDNNYFDIYDLRFSTSGQDFISANIIHNKFNLKYGSSGKILYPVLKDEFSGYRECVFKNNLMNVEHGSDGDALTILSIADNRDTLTTGLSNVVISDNIITAPIRYCIYYMGNHSDLPNMEHIIMTNNTIQSSYTGNSGVSYKSNWVRSIFKNNVFDGMNCTTFFEPRNFYGSGIKLEELTLVKNMITGANNALMLFPHLSSTTPTYYRRYYKFHTPAGIMEFYYTFRMVYNEKSGYGEITFSDESNQPRTCPLTKGSDDVTEGDGTYIKLTDLGDVANTYTVKFLNSSKYNYSLFYINNLTGSDVKVVEIKTIAAGEA